MRRLSHGSGRLTPVAVACAIATLGVAACQRQDGPEARPAPEFDAAFTPGGCATLPPLVAPAAGTLFEGRLTSAGGVDQEIRVRSSSGTSISYTPTLILNNGMRREMKNRAAYFGFLYGEVESNPKRTFEYSISPWELYGLNPGERRAFRVTEHLRGDRGSASADHQFTVEMLGCGILRWSGAEVPVKVFKAEIANASLDRSGRLDGSATDTFTAYLAPQYGWPLLKVYADGGREEVRRVRPPE